MGCSQGKYHHFPGTAGRGGDAGEDAGGGRGEDTHIEAKNTPPSTYYTCQNKTSVYQITQAAGTGSSVDTKMAEPAHRGCHNTKPVQCSVQEKGQFFGFHTAPSCYLCTACQTGGGTRRCHPLSKYRHVIRMAGGHNTKRKQHNTTQHNTKGKQHKQRNTTQRNAKRKEHNTPRHNTTQHNTTQIL